MTDIPLEDKEVSPFYMHAAKMPLASRLSQYVRRGMFDFFMQVMQPQSHQRVLDIGVTSDDNHGESNYFEQFYPYKSQITCVGTEDGSALMARYPGIKFTKVIPGERLPYADKEFDIAFSNAVVEHVGGFESQKQFIAESLRVAKRVFITTPNRWFPVEHHTAIPLLHYLPKSIYRSILKNTRWQYWSEEQNLNLLSLAEFRNCFPENCGVNTLRMGLGLGVFRSNLIAFTN